MAIRANQGVNSTLETFMTRGTGYFTFVDANGNDLSETFPLAAMDSFEVTQTNTDVEFFSASEHDNDRVRVVNANKSIAATVVARDLKPEAIKMITQGEIYKDASVLVTKTVAVKKLGEYIMLDGFATKSTFTLKKGSETVDPACYTLNDGNFRINEIQPSTGALVVADDITYSYTRKEQLRIEASTTEIYIRLEFEGLKVGEVKNNLYKIIIPFAKLDPATFLGHTPEAHAAWTGTLQILADKNARGKSSKYYRLIFVTELDDDELDDF